MPVTTCESSALRNEAISTLYQSPMRASRSGALFCAFPYPTKISPEAIALFIAAHTKPGDTVFDGFAGSGTTGLGALLCEDPPQALRDEAKRLGIKAKWGPRNAALYEVGALGAFVAQTLTNPPDPKAFSGAAEDILEAAQNEDGWLYRALDPDGSDGSVRYIIWSDVLKCPDCRKQATLWDACVSLNPASINSEYQCPHCSSRIPLKNVNRVVHKSWDDLLDQESQQRKRRAIYVYGVTGTKTWSRPASPQDQDLLRVIEKEPIPDSVPNTIIPWGDLYRSGYHKGITHLHHFYTRRNLIVFARMWERVQQYKGGLRDALQFWLLSYNASHATNMTRVIAKTGQKDLVVTSAQPGVLYFSGLPVEKNLISGLRRKHSTITKAFKIIHGRKGKIRVYQDSSCRTHLTDESIDYVFIDPPFGGNIPYAEVNFINEAWLKRYTDRTEEIIVSPSQDKSLCDYQSLLTAALSECYRVLKKSCKATVVFHSSKSGVWNALQSAYQDAGFTVESSSVLNKTQGSFKQVTTSGAVRGDPLILLGKRSVVESRSSDHVWDIADKLWQEAILDLDPGEQTAQRLYSRLVAHFLETHQQVPVDADVFYRWFAEQSLQEVHRGQGIMTSYRTPLHK